jgi:hypothetical protein
MVQNFRRCGCPIRLPLSLTDQEATCIGFGQANPFFRIAGCELITEPGVRDALTPALRRHLSSMVIALTVNRRLANTVTVSIR